VNLHLALIAAFVVMESAIWILLVRCLCTGAAPRFMDRVVASRASTYMMTGLLGVNVALMAMSNTPHYPWHRFEAAAARSAWPFYVVMVAGAATSMGSAWCIERCYLSRRRTTGSRPPNGSPSQ
jgi:hypothetical protein